MFEPKNEMGVVSLFSSMQQTSGFEIVEIGTRFPDGVISVGGAEYKVEFEYLASNFLLHDHDVRGCDIVVCWKNDIKETDFPLHIVELEYSDWYTESVITPERSETEIFYWKNRAKKAEMRLQAVQSEKEELERIYCSDDCTTDRPSAQERRSRLADMVNSGRDVNVAQVAQQFEVSQTLIRRELRELRTL